MINDFTPPDLFPALPEIFVVLMACAILLIDALIGRKHRWITPALTLLTLVGAAIITYSTMDAQVVLTLGNLFVDDLLADFLKLMVYLGVIFVIIYSRAYLQARQLDKGEYYVLVLFATLGMMVMISASHLVSLYLGLELLSLSLYALVALDRDNPRSTEAAMKYFILGSLASGLLLYGMSMIYGATGTLEIAGIAQALHLGVANETVLIFGLVFLVAGIAFKFGAVPFHMWVPDVYQGAPTAVTLFIATVPKLAAFALALRLLVYGLFPLAEHWQQMLLILAILSIALGNLAAIAQTNIKRMFAYSTIAHMGFFFLALLSGTSGGEQHFALNAYSSAMYYVVAYVIMSMGAFGVILLLSRAGHEAEQLEDFKGLNQRSPWFAAVMMVLMFSMAGIPFFIGFFAKFSVLLALVDAGHVAVAVFAVVFSLIGAFYYLRVVKFMYFDPPTDTAPIVASSDMRFLLSVNGAAVVLLGLFPNTLVALCTFAIMRSM